MCKGKEALTNIIKKYYSNIDEEELYENGNLLTPFGRFLFGYQLSKEDKELLPIAKIKITPRHAVAESWKYISKFVKKTYTDDVISGIWLDCEGLSILFIGGSCADAGYVLGEDGLRDKVLEDYYESLKEARNG